jgi:hypothetical protein
MKAAIEVKDRREAEHIRMGLEDPVMRAFVVIMGALAQLPTKRAKMRALNYVKDHFEEQEEIRSAGEQKELRDGNGGDRHE